jgi:hypothetical protein
MSLHSVQMKTLVTIGSTLFFFFDLAMIKTSHDWTKAVWGALALASLALVLETQTRQQ